MKTMRQYEIKRLTERTLNRSILGSMYRAEKRQVGLMLTIKPGYQVPSGTDILGAWDDKKLIEVLAEDNPVENGVLHGYSYNTEKRGTEKIMIPLRAICECRVSYIEFPSFVVFVRLRIGNNVITLAIKGF
jgi:hypothetical protein